MVFSYSRDIFLDLFIALTYRRKLKHLIYQNCKLILSPLAKYPSFVSTFLHLKFIKFCLYFWKMTFFMNRIKNIARKHDHELGCLFKSRILNWTWIMKCFMLRLYILILSPSNVATSILQTKDLRKNHVSVKNCL